MGIFAENDSLLFWPFDLFSGTGSLWMKKLYCNSLIQRSLPFIIDKNQISLMINIYVQYIYI